MPNPYLKAAQAGSFLNDLAEQRIQLYENLLEFFKAVGAKQALDKLSSDSEELRDLIEEEGIDEKVLQTLTREDLIPPSQDLCDACTAVKKDAYNKTLKRYRDLSNPSRARALGAKFAREYSTVAESGFIAVEELRTIQENLLAIGGTTQNLFLDQTKVNSEDIGWFKSLALLEADEIDNEGND